MHLTEQSYPIQNCAILSVSSFGSCCSKSGIYNLICCLQIVQRLKTSLHCIYCQLCLDLSNMAKEKKKNFLKRDSWRFPSSFLPFLRKARAAFNFDSGPTHTKTGSGIAQRPAPASQYRCSTTNVIYSRRGRGFVTISGGNLSKL